MLPDGTRSDAVFLIFHDLYLEVLNKAPRRPLDYRYLQSLPPGPQRFYEIVSCAMYPAIKYGHRARLAYSEFCQRSTLTRYYEFDQVKKQMYKIHLPHVRSGYIAKVEYENTVDEEGRPDWIMFYTPGETARSQQSVFEGALAPARKSRQKKASVDDRPRQEDASATAGDPRQAAPPEVLASAASPQGRRSEITATSAIRQGESALARQQPERPLPTRLQRIIQSGVSIGCAMGGSRYQRSARFGKRHSISKKGRPGPNT
jgi:hypothetical protein